MKCNNISLKKLEFCKDLKEIIINNEKEICNRTSKIQDSEHTENTQKENRWLVIK